jgi:hypothetical protein
MKCAARQSLACGIARQSTQKAVKRPLKLAAGRALGLRERTVIAQRDSVKQDPSAWLQKIRAKHSQRLGPRQ